MCSGMRNYFHNIPDDIVKVCIFFYLEEKYLARVAQTSHKFNTLIEQYRECFYADEDFNMLKNNVFGLYWLASHHPERKCSPMVLDWAARENLIKIVRFLLRAKKSCTANALEGASKYGHIEVVKLLLSYNKIGGELALSEYDSRDTLVVSFALAIMSGHIEIIKLLFAAESSYENYTDWALKHMKRNGYQELAKLLEFPNKK